MNYAATALQAIKKLNEKVVYLLSRRLLLHPVRGATNVQTCYVAGTRYLFQSNALRAGCNQGQFAEHFYLSISINAPRAGCDSKAIQFKRILVARRIYSFANYVLHILKRSPTYCIGTTLQPLIFGAKLPVILCSLKVRTILTALLYHTSPHPASAFVAN